MPRLAKEDLTAAASVLGLKMLHTTDLSPISDARKRLVAWQAAGFAADMTYMQREASLYVDPSHLLAEARSLIAFSVPYDCSRLSDLPKGHGRIARYAWGRDYHKLLKKRIGALVASLQENISKKIKFRIFTDSVPMLERAFASRAGLGFIGKNTMLIQPGLGSFFFVAELLWDIEVDSHSAKSIAPSCKECVQCFDACPTSALVNEYCLDARRCISYLTIEKRGALSIKERKSIGDWLFGCDLCQDACPHNYKALKAERVPEIVEFKAEEGVGASLELFKLLKIRSDEEFSRQFAGTPLMRSKREGLLRNAAVVAANTLSEEAFEALQVAVDRDSSELVRQHALWALCEISKKCNNISIAKLKFVLDKALNDDSIAVQTEAKQIYEFLQ